MAKKSSTQAKIDREAADLKGILEALPDNPIAWGLVIKIVAPIIARLAVRYALKRLDRSMSEDRVNAIGRQVAGFVNGIIASKVAP